MEFEKHITNALNGALKTQCAIAGIIGDRPSQYAKSPSIWNPTLKALGIDAVYVPFDVQAEALGGLVDALRKTDRYVGGNVTVPYKVSIMEYLDEVDEKARQIGAVNAIARTPDGRLVGYNTDGKGGIDTLLKPQPGSQGPFLESLKGRRVLLIGAGGAARALAFYLADEVRPEGRLLIANRTEQKARELSRAVKQAYGNCLSISLDGLADVAVRVDLIVNATTRGQSGLRQLPGGKTTCLEPYSSLAPAAPAELRMEDGEGQASFMKRWERTSQTDIHGNLQASFRLMQKIPTTVDFFDVVYSPLETVMLRQARLTGHRTINGKGMNVAQAADAFYDKVMKQTLETRGLYTEGAYARILDEMYSVW